MKGEKIMDEKQYKEEMTRISNDYVKQFLSDLQKQLELFNSGDKKICKINIALEIKFFNESDTISLTTGS